MEGYGALGFSVNPLQRGISYQLPRDKDIRSHTGVGPSRSVTSGPLARGRLIAQHLDMLAQVQDIFAVLHYMYILILNVSDVSMKRYNFAEYALHMIKSQLLQYA